MQKRLRFSFLSLKQSYVQTQEPASRAENLCVGMTSSGSRWPKLLFGERGLGSDPSPQAQPPARRADQKP